MMDPSSSDVLLETLTARVEKQRQELARMKVVAEWLAGAVQALMATHEGPGIQSLSTVAGATRVERRQSHCPRCNTRVVPTRITPGIGIVIIKNRCEPCGQEWTAEYSAREHLEQKREEGRLDGHRME